MISKAKSVEEYLEEVPEKRGEFFKKLRKVILTNIPKGFQEEMSYGMIGYVVPHSLYPAGYHCNPELPLPFISIASQKNNIAFYHMGLYAVPELLDWFKKEYTKYPGLKLDMGKSCVRFRKAELIPFDLIGQLVQRISVQEWISIYERAIKR